MSISFKPMAKGSIGKPMLKTLTKTEQNSPILKNFFSRLFSRLAAEIIWDGESSKEDL